MTISPEFIAPALFMLQAMPADNRAVRRSRRYIVRAAGIGSRATAHASAADNRVDEGRLRTRIVAAYSVRLVNQDVPPPVRSGRMRSRRPSGSCAVGLVPTSQSGESPVVSKNTPRPCQFETPTGAECPPFPNGIDGFLTQFIGDGRNLFHLLETVADRGGVDGFENRRFAIRSRRYPLLQSDEAARREMDFAHQRNGNPGAADFPPEQAEGRFES